MKAKVWSIAACVIASLLLMLSATLSAQDFYRDKRIRLIVGFPPGGGYDLYTRAIGRHLSRHIPGNPSIIVQNMPGAGSAVAANYLYGPAYPGTVGIRAAMERKEVEAGCWQWSSVKVTAKAMLDAGAAVVFSQLGPRKAPELPHVENAAERVKAETDRTVMTALFSQLSLGRPYIAPPGVPENRVRVLRKAFMDMLQDPKFLEEANRLNLEVGPLAGEEAQKLVAKLKAAPPTILEKLKTIVGTGES